MLKTAKEKFWLDPGDLQTLNENAKVAPPAASDQLITPEELFRNDQR
jgi:hypothetical protein